MDDLNKSQQKINSIIRWTARILSVVSICVVLLFMVGEGFDYTRVKPNEWVLFVFFPFGISIGMLLSWWREGIGGMITVGSFLMFYVAHFVTAGMFPHGWAFLVFTIPGFLFLLSWYRTRKSGKDAA
jgi:hypothetical protein